MKYGAALARAAIGSFVLLLLFALASPASAEVLTLEQCLETSRTRSPALKIASYRIEAAIQNLQLTKAGYRARLNLSTGTSKGGGPGIPGPDYTTYDLNASASYTLYTNGVKAAQLKQASLSLEAAQATYRQQLNELEYEVAKAYYNVLEAQANVRLADQHVTRATKHRDLAQANFDAGIAPKADVLRAAADLAGAKSSLTGAKGALESAKASLNQLLSNPVDEPIDVVEMTPPRVRLATTAVYQQQAEALRPELTKGHLDVASADQNVLAARRAKGVQVSLSASQSLSDTAFFPDLNSRRWSVSIQANYPLMDGGRIKAEVNSAEAVRAQQQSSLLLTQQQVALDVKLAVIDVSTTQAQLTADEAYLASADESLAAATGRYKAGVSNIIELVDAETAYYEAEVQLNRSRYGLLSSLAKLAYAVGKGQSSAVAEATEGG